MLYWTTHYQFGAHGLDWALLALVWVALWALSAAQPRKEGR